MIEFLTSNPVSRFLGQAWRYGRKLVARALGASDKGGVALKALMAALMVGLGLVFYGTLVDYQHASEQVTGASGERNLEELPPVLPLIWQGIGVFLALVAFLVSLWVRGQGGLQETRGNLIIVALWIAAVASLVAWLPTDVIETQQAISGKALAGETPSIPAYLGKLFLIIILILSVPMAAMVYFRLGIMDRYVVHAFLSPFSFCIFSFIAIWLIGDYNDNGATFSGLGIGRVLTFYVVQVPFMITFVMPIAVLLSGLFATSKMSKANEFISMIGAGRSVGRILLPLLVVGAYTSLICLALKYEWAPASVGYKDAIIETAREETWAKRHGKEVKKDIWSRRGWMHVNEVDRRTWFVGKVPYTLSDEMADVLVFQLGENDQPREMWKAKRAKWVWNAKPPQWNFTEVQHYSYDEHHIPRITSHERLSIDSWSETPWKVLSSSQDAEYLGLPGLTMYLNANRDLDKRSLAPFRTNFWYIFAEPAACFVMMLVATPLGIVYSRRGVMGGVVGAIVIFGMMYVMRGTLLALGHGNGMNSFFAAWTTNIVVTGIGVLLLYFRARNREVPKMKSLLKSLFSRKPGETIAPGPGAVAAGQQ